MPEPDARELVGLSEAARRMKALGHPIDKSTLSRHVDRGIIPNLGAPGAPKICVADAIAAVTGLIDQSKRRGPAAPPTAPPPPDEPGDEAAAMPDADELPLAAAAGNGRGKSLAQAQAELYAARAASAQLELDRKRGLLLDRADALDAFRELGVQTRGALRQAAAQLAQELIGLSDPAAIAQRIVAGNTQVLDRLSDEFRRKFEPAAGRERAAG
jgi:hypothetical protein